MNGKKAALFVTALLTACAHSSAPQREAAFRLRDFSVSVPLDSKRGGPVLRCGLSLLEVNAPERDAQFFNALLYSGKSPKAYRDGLAQYYRDQYREERAALNARGIVPPPDFDWDYQERMRFSDYRGRGMVLERQINYFTGGAHGMEHKKYYVIDLEEQRTLAMEDLFREPDGERLRDIVLAELRRYSGGRGFPVAEDEPLGAGIFFEGQIEISSNFWVDETGLGLRWDPYEIAPYAAGGVEIILPWRELRPLMKTEGMELMTKFGIYLFV